MQKQSHNYTIKQIFKNHWKQFILSTYTTAYWILRPAIQENIDKLLRCKDPLLNGYHLYRCPNHHDQQRIIPHTCKSRSCPTCGSLATARWADSLNQAFPNKPYFHITFTVPRLVGLFLFYHRQYVPALFAASAQTMLSWFWDKHHVLPALSSVIHTFGRQLNWHTHIHMIISAGGLKPSRSVRSISAQQSYAWEKVTFIPYQMIAKRFKAKFLHLLKPPMLCYYSQSVIDNLYSINWYAHCSGELDATLLTIGYIGRYTKRPPIAQTNIIDYKPAQNQITFVFKETRSKTPCTYTLPVFEFMKLFIQHIPEKHAKYIYHYGLLANRCRSFYQTVLKSLGLLPWLDKPLQSFASLPYHIRRYFLQKINPLLCSICKTPLVLTLIAVPRRVGNGLYFVYF